MLIEYAVKNCQYTRKATLPSSCITLWFGFCRPVQNLVDFPKTMWYLAATMLKFEGTDTR
jgi:hypothetical protein